MSNNTGGPAFPQNTKLVHAAGQEVHQGFMGGMTLRDYFAAKAMQSTFYPAILESIRIDKDLDCGIVARFAYQMADAMLKTREER